MDIAWHCGRNGRRIFVLAVCRLYHWDLSYNIFFCQQFHLGGGDGRVASQFIYAGVGEGEGVGVGSVVGTAVGAGKEVTGAAFNAVGAAFRSGGRTNVAASSKHATAASARTNFARPRIVRPSLCQNMSEIW